MADKYAFLPVSERVDAAVDLMNQYPDLTARKAAQIFNIHHSSVVRRSKGLKQPRKKAEQALQRLFQGEECTRT